METMMRCAAFNALTLSFLFPTIHVPIRQNPSYEVDHVIRGALATANI